MSVVTKADGGLFSEALPGVSGDERDVFLLQTVTHMFCQAISIGCFDSLFDDNGEVLSCVAVKVKANGDLFS